MNKSEEQCKKVVGTTWLAGNASCTLIIPKPLAVEYGLDQPSNVVIQGRPEGILIRKLEVDNSRFYDTCPHCAANRNALKDQIKDKIKELHRNGRST